MCKIEDYEHLELDKSHRTTLEQELDGWHTWYLPIGDTVLDLGAGCGETAYFYLRHGARRVVCIESDPAALTLLERNFGNDDRVTIIGAHIDSIKVDIEGSERS